MKTFENKTFDGLGTDFRWSRRVCDLQFFQCHFLSSYTSPTKNPSKRFWVQNVHIKNCTHQACSLHTTILEDIVVDGLQQKGRSPLFLWGCAFRHVKLAGKISAPKINAVASLSPSPSEITLWRNSDTNFYLEVDWALDISEAKFNTVFDIPGVPANLIRRDPESQIIVRRDNLLASTWKPTAKAEIWSVGLKWFLESGYPDIVMVAGKSNPKYKQWKDDIKRLRDIGVAETD